MATAKPTRKREGAYTARREDIDWESVERHYRAGVMSVSELSKQFGVSRPAIEKRAEKEGWTRNIQEKIEQSTTAKIVGKVAADEVAKRVAAGGVATSKLTEAAVVEAYADAATRVDSLNRSDIQVALDAHRALLGELVLLTRPDFAERLEWLGQVMDESGPDPETGRMVKDKVNEFYQYVISLPGRIKMAKEVAAAYQVYIPMQRKVFGLDAEKKTTATVEDLLAKLASEAKE